MFDRRGVIYAVKHIELGRVIYVGQTRRPPHIRWAEHARGKTPFSKAIDMFGALSDFAFEIVETVPVSELNIREEYWIGALGTMYPAGLNHRSGGNAPFVSDATRAKQSDSIKSVMSTAEFRAWRSATSKAGWEDTETRQTMVHAIKAAWQRPERRARHKQAMAVAMADPDRRARISATMKAFKQAQKARVQAERQ